MRVKYDWLKWFERRRFVLREGRDYDCTTKMMAQQVRNAASVLSKSISIIETTKGLIVVVNPNGDGAASA